jgi:hypothetical protein
VHPGDPQRRLAHPGAQFRRVDEFGLDAEREHVGHRLVGGFDRYPRPHPAVTPRAWRGAPADPYPGWPAEQHGHPTSARRQQNRGAGASSGRGGRVVMQPTGRQVAGEAFDQLETAEFAAYRVDRDAGRAQRFNVTQHSALRDLKLGRELRRRHPAASLQQAKQPD